MEEPIYWWSEVAQLCLTLCNPMDCGLPGSSVHGIFQARILEWVSISFARGSSWPRDRTRVSRTAGRLFTIWATREAGRKERKTKNKKNSFTILLWSTLTQSLREAWMICTGTQWLWMSKSQLKSEILRMFNFLDKTIYRLEYQENMTNPRKDRNKSKSTLRLWIKV